MFKLVGNALQYYVNPVIENYASIGSNVSINASYLFFGNEVLEFIHFMMGCECNLILKKMKLKKNSVYKWELSYYPEYTRFEYWNYNFVQTNSILLK